ncbi:hypothetical protein AALO_G00095480, partial [Alosa alosa]
RIHASWKKATASGTQKYKPTRGRNRTAIVPSHVHVASILGGTSPTDSHSTLIPVPREAVTDKDKLEDTTSLAKCLVNRGSCVEEEEGEEEEEKIYYARFPSYSNNLYEANLMVNKLLIGESFTA